MGIAYNTSTVTEGLVLAFDIANPRCYPKAGTNLRNLVDSTNNSTIQGTVNFDPGAGGNLAFDGSANYVDFFAPNLGTTTTVEMWVSLGVSYAGNMFFGFNSYDVWCSGGNIGFNTGNSDLYGISSATVTSLGLVGNPKHYVFEMRSDLSYANNKIYINGFSQSLSQLLATESSANRNFNSGNGRIAGWLNSSLFRMPMNWSNFRVYNRALTQNEINQNFSALRGRYGV
jgi:hypothetical protein